MSSSVAAGRSCTKQLFGGLRTTSTATHVCPHIVSVAAQSHLGGMWLRI